MKLSEQVKATAALLVEFAPKYLNNDLFCIVDGGAGVPMGPQEGSFATLFTTFVLTGLVKVMYTLCRVSVANCLTIGQETGVSRASS